MKSVCCAFAALTCVVLASCDNAGRGIASVATPPDEHIGVSPEPHVTLRPAPIGGRSDKRVWLANNGEAPYRVEAFRVTGPLASELRLPPSGFEVRPGESIPVDIGFEPADLRQVDPERSSITFVLSNAQVDTLSLLTLRGHVLPNLTVAPSVEFGEVAAGTTATRMLAISNPTEFRQSFAARLLSSTLESGELTVSEASIPVGAHMVVSIPVTYRPREVRPFSASIRIVSGSDVVADVPVTGEAVPQAAACHAIGTVVPHTIGVVPCEADFGFVAPGTSKTAEIAFTNDGATDAAVEIVGVEGPGGGFSLPSGPGVLAVPSGGKARLQVRLSPIGLGAHRATLRFRVGTLTGAIGLLGFSGGPDVHAIPSALDFGPVASGTYQHRRVAIANVGVAVPGMTDGVLRLAIKDGGAWVPAQPELVGGNAGDFAIESVGTASADEISPGTSLDLRVKFAPTGPGARSTTLIVHTNDPDEPTLEVPIRGTGLDLDGCDYDIVPPSLACNFEEGTTRSLSLYFRNTSSLPCVITNIAPTADSNFSDLTPLSPPFTPVTVSPMQTQEFPISFKGGGTLVFSVVSRTKPETRVNVCRTGNPTQCLLLSPADLDFSVPVGSWRGAEIRAFNVCSASRTIDSIRLSPGTSSEFSLMGLPTLPAALAPGANSSFTLVYAPTDAVKDIGRVEVYTASVPEPAVVSFSGSPL